MGAQETFGLVVIEAIEPLRSVPCLLGIACRLNHMAPARSSLTDSEGPEELAGHIDELHSGQEQP